MHLCYTEFNVVTQTFNNDSPKVHHCVKLLFNGDTHTWPLTPWVNDDVDPKRFIYELIGVLLHITLSQEITTIDYLTDEDTVFLCV